MLSFTKKITKDVSTQTRMKTFLRMCMKRHLSWLFIVLFMCATGWIVFVWSVLFRSELLTQEDIAAVRAAYSGTPFDRTGFDAVIARTQTRRDAFDTPVHSIHKDIFFPETYTPAPETDR